MPHDHRRAHAQARNLESLQKEAKRWLHALESENADVARTAHERLSRAIPAEQHAKSAVTLRDVQHALARENGFAGWTELRLALTPSAAKSAEAMGAYEEKALALLEAYQTGTPDALERHYALTWHRRVWPAMRSYVQLDLGKRPAHDGDDVSITIDDARLLIAREHGFENWQELQKFAVRLPGGLAMAATPIAVRNAEHDDAITVLSSRDWGAVLEALANTPGATLDANGQMTDELLEQISHIGHVQSLKLGNSKHVTDAGVRHLARMRELRVLDLSQSAVTDAGLEVLRELPTLESLALVMTRVTDAGLENLQHCQKLKHLNLMWTNTGNGALRALAGNEHFTHFWSGNFLTDDGLALLRDIPAFKSLRSGVAPHAVPMALLRNVSLPNQLTLRGSFTDRGLQHLRGLNGLTGLDLDDSALPISAQGLESLVALPNLARLSVDAKDDWMPVIAAMPALRFLSAQDTTATDAGWEALSKSPTIEFIWGRRCHGLQGRGFRALATMQALCGLSVSCLNVDDHAIAALPEFPALRELMPMDIPDAGYRHIGRCHELDALLLMYCRNTTDAATEHVTGLAKLRRYFNSYTTITDRTPELLSAMDTLEEVTFDECHGLTNAGVAQLARLPRLRTLRVAGNQITRNIRASFAPGIVIS